MKRLIVALGVSAFAVSAHAFEVTAPFDQLQIDRALPQIEFAPVEPYVADGRAPFEQLALDRALPNLPSQNVQVADGSSAGNTRSDASTGSEMAARSPWANDYHFIAPAQ